MYLGRRKVENSTVCKHSTLSAMHVVAEASLPMVFLLIYRARCMQRLKAYRLLGVRKTKGT